ncbi:MAG: HAD-IC family P-type ATPase, partial [Gillisia sp.]|nr:HAD-IC family P-type ATPase [Gillisia sp.]
DHQVAGLIAITDTLKETTKAAIKALKEMKFKVLMITGDNIRTAKAIAQLAGIDQVLAEVLPQDKSEEVKKLQEKGEVVAFVGDGINDAPVLALSDVGIAMGAMGSDVAIETADVVLQSDEPSKIIQGILIGRSTRKIVWQNIVLALGVKVAVLILGAWGLASLWGAVFADVGVAFLAILNAIRLQKMKWD